MPKTKESGPGSLSLSAKSELLVAVKMRGWSTIPSIYDQWLFMGPKYNATIGIGELREHQNI